MNRAQLVFVLNQLLIQKGLLEANLNAKEKNMLHLEKLTKRKHEKIRNNFDFINLIFI